MRRSTLTAVMILSAVAVVPAAGQTAAGVVTYYQVTYDDGDVKDLASIPQTAEGIRRVLRITRVHPSGRGYKVYGTGSTPIAEYNSGRTFRHEMTWDGTSWGVPGERRQQRAAAGSAQTGPKAGLRASLEEEIRTLRETVARMGERLAELDLAVARARRRRELAADDRQREEAQHLLDRLERRRKRASRLVRDHAAALRTLTGPDSRLGEPTGQATPLDKAPEGQAGIVKPTDKEVVLPHNVQVWPVERGTGRRRYAVSMAHVEAGPAGGFYYVAYADTDGDGVPDELVAHSPLAVARDPGGWSQWAFETDRERVFVGNAWPGDRTPMFCARPGREEKNWRGLSTEVYVSGVFGACPTQKYWPYIGNIRVRAERPHPDAEPTGPKVRFND